MINTGQYKQHPRFGTPECVVPTPGFLDRYGRHLDGRIIAREAYQADKKTRNGHIFMQIKAAGAGEEFRYGSTPWQMPYTWG